MDNIELLKVFLVPNKEDMREKGGEVEEGEGREGREVEEGGGRRGGGGGERRGGGGVGRTCGGGMREKYRVRYTEKQRN